MAAVDENETNETLCVGLSLFDHQGDKRQNPPGLVMIHKLDQFKEDITLV